MSDHGDWMRMENSRLHEQNLELLTKYENLRKNSLLQVDAYKRKLIEALEKWQHKDSSLNGYYEILDFIKQWEPGEK